MKTLNQQSLAQRSENIRNPDRREICDTERTIIGSLRGIAHVNGASLQCVTGHLAVRTARSIRKIIAKRPFLTIEERRFATFTQCILVPSATGTLLMAGGVRFNCCNTFAIAIGLESNHSVVFSPCLIVLSRFVVPVTSIASNAFSWSSLRSIVIPRCVETLDSGCFYSFNHFPRFHLNLIRN
jgi:hypothetical protein